MQTNFFTAISQIAEEKGLPVELILETVEAALAAAYRKDYGDKDQTVRVQLDPKSGETRIFVSKEVSEEVENEHLQITLADAKKYQKDAKIGDVIEYEDHPEGFGRVAAQTAKQVIIQRIREAEREIIFNEYKDKENQIINGSVQRVDGSITFVDIGKTNGVLYQNEQIPGEHYYPGQRLKVYVVSVEQTTRGPQIILSRAHANLVRALFEREVPELESAAVEIKGIAREAGVRTKVAVRSNTPSIDAVGTFVGGRGARVQAVMTELGEEKIDIILFDDDPKAFITNALSPTKVVSVALDEKDKKAIVKVPEDQLSLAIGKQGQNVRLAARLTGWNIDIVSADESRVEATAEAAQPKPAAKGKVDLEASLIEAVNQGTDETKVVAPEPAAPQPAEPDTGNVATNESTSDKIVGEGESK